MAEPGVDVPRDVDGVGTVRSPVLNLGAASVGVVLLYVATAKLSLLLAIAPGFATPVWPPSGIAAATVLLYGVRLWPAVWLGAFLANAGDTLPWIGAAGIATGNVLEALCARWLMRRLVGPEVRLANPEAAFRFAAAAAGSGIVAASFGTLVLAAAGLLEPGQALANWFTWWQGDTTGMMVLTPLLLAWMRPQPGPAMDPLRRTELATFATTLAATFAIVLALGETQPDLARSLSFLLIAVVAWAGGRFGERAVTTTVLAITAVAVWAAVEGRAPFTAASTGDALLALQAFVATIAVMGLALAALTRQRAEAERALREAGGRLEAAVAARTEELAQKNRELASELTKRVRLAAALERRDAQLAEAQAITHTGSWNWDVGTDRMTWSGELMRIFGPQPGDVDGTFAAYLARVHPEDRARVQKTVQDALISRQPWESTDRIVRADGAVRLLRTLGGVWTDPGGGVTSLYAACLDVTESQRRERIQLVQHEITRVLVRAPDWPEAVAEAMRIVGETLDWVLGQMWTVDADDVHMRVHGAWSKGDYDAFVEGSRSLRLARGEGLPGRVWRDASAQWIEDMTGYATGPRVAWAKQCRLHGALCFPLTAGGRVLGVLEFFASERRRPEDELLQAVVALGSQLGEYIVRNRAERLLRESEERFRLLIEGVKEYAIVMLDPAGRVATWNSGAARINGYATEEIVGRHFSCFHTADERAQGRPEALLKAAIEQGSVVDEGWRVRKDGSRFWANVVVTVLYGPDGALRGFAKVTRDMTERKQVEALEEAGRQTRQFLAMLGHELRNPLAPIRNAVGVMRLREIADPQIKYCRDLIERQVSQLARLVDDLLDASRITTGTIGLHLERLDVAQVVALAVEASRPNIDNRNHKLAITPSPEPLEVSGDRTRLVQVVQNLLNNAAKYTPPGGHIALETRREGEMAVIEVRDDGTGIAPDMLPRIFELFVQADGGLSRSEGGLGVGLTLARRIVEMHGGSIQGLSEGIGHGATFVVRLPLVAHVTTPAARPVLPADGAASPLVHRRSVLVVDDNQDAADSVAALLDLRGHQVWSAYDGPAALALAAEHAPEVILLDIGLPGMDGYEVAARLRAMPATAASTVVALTGYGQEEDRRRTEQARFDAHLVKPVEYETLCALIENTSGAQPAERRVL